MSYQINQTVKSAKHGAGVITRIITKSTGYLEVNFNGNVRKEMAANLIDENGAPLKNKKTTEFAGMSVGEKKRAQDAKSIAANPNSEWLTMDKNTFEERSAQDANNSISW